MADEKQIISRHKTVISAGAAAQPNFHDVLPPDKVRASASSRPVIMPSTPSVADNTLVAAVSAPVLDLSKAGKDEAPASPEEKGVLLSDLMAKREKAAASADGSAAEDAKQISDGADKDITKDKTVNQNPDEPTAETDGKLLQDVDGPAADVTPVSKPADDSLDAVLQAEEKSDHATGNANGQTDTLKAAMKDLDDKDGRPHYELYGGKPVIIVHKGKRLSGLMWTVWFMVCLGLALLAVNVLLDAGIITTDYVIPHTNFL